MTGTDSLARMDIAVGERYTNEYYKNWEFRSRLRIGYFLLNKEQNHDYLVVSVNYMVTVVAASLTVEVEVAD